MSFAALVDRPLLRQARVRLVPGADAGAEADLWLSPLVKSRSSEGITFTPEVAAVLRARLAADPARKDEAWKLTQQVHEHLPPTLKLEETVNHLSIDRSEEAARRIDELLSSVLAAMASGGRDGLASWAARALASFPSSVRTRSTARMLAAGASLRLGVDPRKALGSEMPEWLRFIAPAQLPLETIAVQLAPGVLRVDASKNPSGQHLRLPATRPYLIDVSWLAEDGKEEGLQLALRAGDVQHVPVGAGEIQLRTVAGDLYELRLGGTAPADVRRHIIDFSEVLKAADDKNVDKLVRKRSFESGVTLIVGPPGTGKTNALASLCRRLLADGFACAHHFFESGTPPLEYREPAERSLIAQLMARYDAPPWAVTMRLPDFLRMIASKVGTGPVYIVLDNVDVVRGHTVGDVLGPFMQLPPQFVIVASATRGGTSVMRTIELELHPQKVPPLPPAGSSPRRYLDALALARAPLPLPDADRLRARVDLSTLDVEPWTVRRPHLGEPSVTIASEFLREVIRTEVVDAEAAHRELEASTSVDDRERTWYGVRHGAWHRLRSGDSWASYTSPRLLQRAIELFGADVAADAVEEGGSEEPGVESIAPAPATLVGPALRQNAQQANDAPHDVAPLLYSALRRDQRPDGEIELALALDATDVSLRIETYIPPEDVRPRVRPPAPVAAIHAPEDRDDVVLRCENAVMFVDADDRATTFLTPPLTASARHGDLLVTGDAEGTVTFWDTSSASMIQRAAAHQGQVTHVLVHAERVFSCGADGMMLQWEKKKEEWTTVHTTAADAGISAAAILDDRVVIGCRNGDLFEFSPHGTVHHARAHEGPVTGVALLRPSNEIVSVGADRFLRACRYGAPESAIRLATGHTTGITGLAVSASGDLFATYALDRSVRVWGVRVEARTELAVIDVSAAVTAVCFGRVEGEAEWLVVGAADGTVQAGPPGQGLVSAVRRHRSAVRACAVRKGIIFTGGDDARLVRSDDHLIVVSDGGITDCASDGGTVAVCAAGRVDVIRAAGRRNVGRGGSRIALSPDGGRVLLWHHGAGFVNELDVERGHELRSQRVDAPVVQCAYVNGSPFAVLANGSILIDFKPASYVAPLASAMVVDGSSAVIGTERGEVVSIGPDVGSRTISRHSAPVTVVAATVDYVASGTVDGEVVVWGSDFRARRDAGVAHLAFSELETLVAAYEDAFVAIWHHRSGKLVASCVGHKAAITGLVTSKGRIYTASLDRTVRVWDLEGNQRGIVYGDVPFSTLTLIRGEAMRGEVLASDDAGALWALTYHDALEHEPPPGAEEMPRRKRPSVKTGKKKPLRKKMSKKK